MKRIFAAMTAALLMVALVAGAAVAKPSSSGNLIPGQWRVYNVMPATNSYWDINKPQTVGSGLQFPIQQFLTATTGSFAVYLLDNYNVNITGKTLSADLAWTAGTYKTRSTVCAGAYVRLEFQDVTAGPYDPNDYWWSTVSLDLNAASSGTLIASLGSRTLWTNMAGKSATDTAAPWTYTFDGGLTSPIVAMSPYDGFTKAMKNVKQLGLSFGSSCTYASGVAIDGAAGTFTMSSFTVN